MEHRLLRADLPFSATKSCTKENEKVNCYHTKHHHGTALEGSGPTCPLSTVTQNKKTQKTPFLIAG